MASGSRKRVDIDSGEDYDDLSQNQPAYQASSSGAAIDPASQIAESSSSDSENEDSMPRRKGRRTIARGLYVHKRVKEGGKIGGVRIDPAHYVATGPNEEIFKMELGVIARDLAPFQLLNWHELKRQNLERLKLPLYTRLENEFNINMEDPHVREVVDAAFAKRFRSYKHRCHQHYLTFDDPQKAKKKPMAGMKSEVWIALCEHFASDEFKRASAANRNNRSKVRVRHSCGQKSICQRIYEMKDSEDLAQEAQEEPVEMKVFYDTHTRNGIWIDPEAEQNYEDMKILYTKSIESGDGLTGKEIVEKVAKPKTSYVRGLGYGFRASTTVRAPREGHEALNSELQERLNAQEAQMKAQQDKMEAQEAQMKAQEDKMEAQQDEIDELKSLVAKLLEKKKKKKKKKTVEPGTT